MLLQGEGYVDVARTRDLWYNDFLGPQAVIKRGLWVDKASVGIPYIYITSAVDLADIAQQRGDTAESRKLMETARKLGDATDLSRLFNPPVAPAAPAVPLAARYRRRGEDDRHRHPPAKMNRVGAVARRQMTQPEAAAVREHGRPFSRTWRRSPTRCARAGSRIATIRGCCTKPCACARFARASIAVRRSDSCARSRRLVREIALDDSTDALSRALHRSRDRVGDRELLRAG